MKDLLKKLITEFPNDADLGKQIRNLFNNLNTKNKQTFYDIGELPEQNSYRIRYEGKPEIIDFIIENDYAGKTIIGKIQNYYYDKIDFITPWTN
jgi:hypothetical protein